MNDALIKEAEEIGLNVSMYYLLPPNKREAAIKADIAKEKQRKE